MKTLVAFALKGWKDSKRLWKSKPTLRKLSGSYAMLGTSSVPATTVSRPRRNSIATPNPITETYGGVRTVTWNWTDSQRIGLDAVISVQSVIAWTQRLIVNVVMQNADNVRRYTGNRIMCSHQTTFSATSLNIQRSKDGSFHKWVNLKISVKRNPIYILRT